MTIQQTVTIPADRRVYFDLPETARIGTATVILEFPTTPAASALPTVPVVTEEEMNRRGKIVRERLERNRRLLKPGDDPLLAWRGVSEGLVPEEEALAYKLLDKRLEEEHEARLMGLK
jgi:hypothetical protein